MHRRWFPAALVAASLLVPAGAARAASCPGADTAISPATLTAAKAVVLCIVNAERGARGLPALAANDELAIAAQRHTDDMVARNFFDHFAPEPAPFGVDPGARITAAGYLWQAYGENIAVGQVTPREVMTSWIRSHGHCRNILSPDVTELGVGVAAVPATLGAQQGGTWTQDFANPQGVVAPAASSEPQTGCDPSGYPALIGLDAPGQSSSESSGSGPTPTAGAPAAQGNPAQNIDVQTAPSDPSAMTARTLNVSLRHAGNFLTVAGSLRPRDGKRHRVSVVIRRGTHTLRRLRTRLDKRGRFRIRVSPIPGRGSLTVRVSIGALHVTRTVGR